MKNKDIEYAIAIYNLGLQEKKVISFNNSLATITSALKNENYFLFLQSKFIDKSIIISSIEKVFFNIDKEIIALLKLLLRNDDIKKIFSIYKNYQELVDDYFSIKRGIIYTTQKLSSAEKGKMDGDSQTAYHYPSHGMEGILFRILRKVMWFQAHLPTQEDFYSDFRTTTDSL